jgi:hypothetical protein
MPTMAKSFWIGLLSTLMAVLFWIVPSLDQFASALELPEDLQNLLNQAAADLNFPYPAPADEDEDSAEQTPDVLDRPLDRRTSVTAPLIEAPAPPSEAQKGTPSPQHPD